MTLGQHIKALASEHTIEELWAAYDSAKVGPIKCNYMGAILAKLRTTDWQAALATRNAN